MIVLAFFFLLCPGEYTAHPDADNAHPFRLKDVQLFIGPPHRIPLATATAAELRQTTFVTLTFTHQKNGVKGEVVGHAHSGDPCLCPVLALIRRVDHLHAQHAPLDTPLATAYNQHGQIPILPKHITLALRNAVAALGPNIRFLPPRCRRHRPPVRFCQHLPHSLTWSLAL